MMATTTNTAVGTLACNDRNVPLADKWYSQKNCFDWSTVEKPSIYELPLFTEVKGQSMM